MTLLEFFVYGIVVSSIGVVLTSYLYYKRMMKQAKAEAEAEKEERIKTEQELKNYKKSLFRAVDLHGQLKAENIKLKEQIESERQWEKFLQIQG